MTLEQFFLAHPRAALGLSGGTDSAYLLYAGLRCGADVRPYYVKTEFQPQFELDDAVRLAGRCGVELTVLRLSVLEQPAIAENPAGRCYLCKLAIFGALTERARADGYPAVLDGTNASDSAADRPGMRALGELAVLSPLRACGLTKSDVRALSKEAGLFTWNKPSYACLATRVPAGMPITAELLRRVECAEDALFRLGFRDFRVRVCGGGAARLEVAASQADAARQMRRQILEAVRPYFDTLLPDAAERRSE